MENVAVLKEENEKLRKEVEALLQAKEIAKEKVRSAIQELVDENKRLKKKVTTLEAQVASLLAERVNLVQRLGETGNSTGGLAGSQDNGPRARSFTEADVSQEKGLHKSMSANLSSALEHNSTPVERSYSSDDLNGRAKKGAGTTNVEVSDLTGSMRTASRRPSSSKAASFFGLTETKIIDEMKNVPEALTIEEPGLLMMRLENELLEIKGGFLAKLVERLYHPTTAQQAPMYANTFFLTYRAFASTVDVANLLFEAYEARVKDDSSQSKEQRERILKIFGQWLEIQPEDFQTLGEQWDRFLADSVVKADGRGWVKELQKVARLPSRVSAPILEETSTPKNGGAASSPRSMKKEKLPKSIVPRGKGFSLDDLDPVEMARQLTLIDYELFQRIRPCELNNLSWNRKEKETEAPNLLKMIHRFNEVSIWVQYVIVSAENLKKRATYVEKFVKIGQQFLKHKNYNGIMQIVSAMEGAAIHRLNKTFEKVKPGTKKKYQHLHELMSASSSYKSYRESIQDKEPPCIPYVGVHLTDLTAMYETHKNTLAPKYPDYLNFSKHQNVANLMRMIIKYQSSTYQLYTVPVIKEWIIGQLDKFGPTPEEKLFEMSLAAEPRED